MGQVVPYLSPRRVCVLATSVALLGCQLADSLQEVGDVLSGNEVETVDGEGDALIAGRFHSLRFDGNNPDGVFVVALEAHEEAPSELTLIPFPSGEGECSAGPARSYAQAKSRPGRQDSKGEARIPFTVPVIDGAPSALRFATFGCEVDDVEVSDSGLPLDGDFAATPGFIAQTAEPTESGGLSGELFFVSPWEEQLDLIATNLSPIVGSDMAVFAEGSGEKWMWSIESGRIVARDNRFRVQGRVGRDVDQFQHLVSPAGPLIAYHERAGGIYTAPVSDLSNATLIEQDGCRFAMSVGPNGVRLLYYAPCVEPDLVMYEVETGARTVIAENVVNHRLIGDRPDGPVVLYVEAGGLNATVGTLRARFGGQAPVLVGENGHLGLTRLTSEGALKAVLDFGDNGGALRAGEVGGKLAELATGVIYYSSLGVIGDWDGDAGTLYQFDDAGEELVEVAQRVTTSGMKYDHNTKRGLVLVGYDGVEGELTLIRDRGATALAERVRADSYQFTVQLPTVTILNEFDTETSTATLRLRETETTMETVVSEGVSEVLEVSWPKAGFLYSVPVGERAGIWFTEAQ